MRNPDYGYYESNPLGNGRVYHALYRNARKVGWDEPGLKITRLRLLGDPGFPYFDVSYCHGRIGEELVEVLVPFSQVPRKGMTAFLLKEASRDGLYLKGTGLFDGDVISILK